jgi:signal transduction histidine kinase
VPAVTRTPVALLATGVAAALVAALIGAALGPVPGVISGLAVAAAGTAIAGMAVRRLVTRELAQQRAQRDQLLEALPSAVLLFQETTLVHANRAALRILHIEPEGDGHLPQLRDESADALLHAVEEASAVGRAVAIEIERDGAVLAAQAVELTSGETALVVRDVTRERRLAAVRRDFVINASHELKTPVAGIQALADSLALALRHDPARGARMVQRIEQEAERLARLVRDLLDLARLEEREQDQEQRPVDVVKVVAGQLDRLQAAADSQGVAVRTELPETAVVVAAPEDVRSIVANLLENAVRYNRRGGSVSVQVSRHDGRVALEIVDTGEGIAPDDRERIFERFYRVDKARSRAAGGTGLGLSLVRHAVQRLGGTIVVHSELGAGSTFRVELPVAQD